MLAARPNPGKISTVFTYDVPVPGGSVSLIAYDLSGRRRKVIVSQRQIPGPYQVTWDGKDEFGHPVRPGVYYLELVYPGGTNMARVVMLR